MIACDHCEARTRQPLPHGWRVLWLSDARAYGHACPICGERLDAGEVLLTLANPAATLAAVRAFAGRVATERADAMRAEVGGADEVLGAAEDELGGLPQGDKSLPTEPAEGVEIYDRPRLPRTLRDAPDGASVADFVRKVGETFVPPAATRPRAAAPVVKSPSEPPPPAQRSLFGGES